MKPGFPEYCGKILVLISETHWKSWAPALFSRAIVMCQFRSMKEQLNLKRMMTFSESALKGILSVADGSFLHSEEDGSEGTLFSLDPAQIP